MESANGLIKKLFDMMDSSSSIHMLLLQNIVTGHLSELCQLINEQTPEALDQNSGSMLVGVQQVLVPTIFGILFTITSLFVKEMI